METCKWIQSNKKTCTLKAVSNKHYCKLHHKFEGLFEPSELNNIKRCNRCDKPYKNEDNSVKKCDKCISNLKEYSVKLAIKRNKNKKKCEWVNQKGVPCAWKTNKPDYYCKRHSVYNMFTPDDIPNLAKCSGCKNLFKCKGNLVKADGKKTCEKCQQRSRKASKKKYINQKKCVAITKNKKKQCNYRALENDDYCMKHQRVKQYNGLVAQNKKICKNWVRGCFNELTTKDKSYCGLCRDSKNNNKITKLTIYEEKFNTYRGEAKRRKIEWVLEKEQSISLFKNECIYCGINNGLNGIDRINSEKGYTLENTTTCCGICNKMKLNHTVETFINIITHLVIKLNLVENPLLYKKSFSYINPQLLFFKSKINTSYVSYKKSCTKRNIKLNISETEYTNILTYPCNYCGCFNQGANGIDRIYSELHYEIDNIVPCCKTCNLLKGPLTLLQFKQKLKNIYNNSVLNKRPDYESNPKNKLISLLSKNNIKITTFPQLKLSNPIEYYENLIFKGNMCDVMNMKIKLVFVDSKNKELFEIWQYYRKTISSFKTKKGHCLFGKRIYILVQDEISNKYLGILSLSSDIKFLGARDNFIGWEKHQQFTLKKLDHLVNITTCVSTQPFGFNFNGGKLLTTLAFSKEVLEFYYEKYNTHILGITTMSLYGKSVQYDRLKCIKYIGMTKGNSLKNVPQEALEFAKQHLQENELLTPSLNKNNMWALKKCLNKLQIPVEDVLKSTPKGIYFGYTSPDSKEYLLSDGGNNVPNPITKAKTCIEIFDWWKNRWAKQRFTHLENNHKLK